MDYDINAFINAASPVNSATGCIKAVKYYLNDGTTQLPYIFEYLANDKRVVHIDHSLHTSGQTSQWTLQASSVVHGKIYPISTQKFFVNFGVTWFYSNLPTCTAISSFAFANIVYKNTQSDLSPSIKVSFDTLGISPSTQITLPSPITKLCD